MSFSEEVCKYALPHSFLIYFFIFSQHAVPCSHLLLTIFFFQTIKTRFNIRIKGFIVGKTYFC